MASPDIAGRQWAKYSFLATLAGATCLHRSDIGGIVARDGGLKSVTLLALGRRDDKLTACMA